MNKKKSLFSRYLQHLRATAHRGDAREESFYPSLKTLLEEMARECGRSEIHVTTLPKNTEAGSPDFRVWNGKDRVVGYIEAKNPSEERLDEVERSEQLRRYRETFPNLILTNFLEFRLYRNGERIESVVLGRPFVLNELHVAPPLEKPEELWALLEHFFEFSLPTAYTAESLAIELAKRTRFLREVVTLQLKEEASGKAGALTGFCEAFQKFLIGHLTTEDFANLYAQTITYGLFAARTRATNGFSRRAAFDRIPRTVGVLRDLFRFISFGDLPRQVEWIVDDISEVLAVADASGILDRYFHEGKGNDPIVHFYETFLAQYDPEERERRGVYYTPEPVVSYIVRSLHALLKKEFGMRDGLASEGVTLLDPAAGTMTFVALAATLAVREFERKYGSGGREEFVRSHILRNFCAFELMMAPYAVGHLKMSFFLEELGHKLEDDERVRFYLTNTLDMEELEQSRLPGISSLAEESHLAAEVKTQAPILVILGNPPYSGHSVNRGEWILGKIEDYKQVDGRPLGERNPKWLQDDYVKFLRFAQWKIDQAGRGVVGMITNHSYLDNPTFRGMRQSLMRTFDEIFVLDLHGNSLKKEICPDGSKDENVFDIRQGVAVIFLVKKGKKRAGPASVRHAEQWGTRSAKYAWLSAHEVGKTGWRKVDPRSESYLFVPQDGAGRREYQRFHPLNEVFPLYGVGMTTARDEFVIDMDRRTLINRMRVFKHSDLADQGLHQFFAIRRKQGWSIRRAWTMLNDVSDRRLEGLTVPVLYRPFDIRWIFYHDSVVWRTVKRVMCHLIAGENLALVSPKQHKHEFGAFVSKVIGAHKSVAAYDINYYFPLYLYPDGNRRDLFAHHDASEREPNLNPELLNALAKAHRHKPSPEEVFNYIYAILYSETYRRKFAEFLKRDFPRIPFPTSRKTFKALASLGERLVRIHLLESTELDPPLARFEGAGDGRIGKNRGEGFRYEEGEQRLYINKRQHFAPVPPEVWNFQIGGYQVCEKWLKDRRERKLDLLDVQTFCRILTAMGLTQRIQSDIDKVFPMVEVEGQFIPGAQEDHREE
ncbi:MAG: N-6 DNA methylase [Candidatus Omnitrophica bacterium]|nr:hypothetical protein [bacterium]NUN96860.1 N-6 DNA methylase [Candidatus Omnitrophota bacterium]